MSDDLEETPSGGGLPNWESVGRLIQVLLGLAALTAIFTLPFVAYQSYQARRANDLAATQIALQGARPAIQGQAVYEYGSREDLDSIRTDMIEDFFRAMIKLRSEKFGTDFVVLMPEALPITRTVSPQPIVISVGLQNNGTQAATDVNVRVDWQGSITKVDVTSLAPWKVIADGIGSNGVSASIQRISVGEAITLEVTYAPTTNTADILELAVDHTNEAASRARQAAGAGSASEETGAQLPTFLLIPSPFTPAFDLIRVRYSASNTGLQELLASPRTPLLGVDWAQQFLKGAATATP